MTPFRLAVLSLTRRRVSSIIALASIAISVACSGVLLRLYWLSGSRFSSLAHGGDAIIGAKAGDIGILLGSLNLEGSYPGFIPLKLYQSLNNRTMVQFEDGVRINPNFLRAVIPFVYFAKYKNFRVIGTDESFLKRPDPEDSPTFSSGRWASGPGEVVLGSELAANEGLKVGDRVPLKAWTSDDTPEVVFEGQVSGVFEATHSAWDQALFSSLDEAKKILAARGTELNKQSIWSADVLNYYLVYLAPDGYPSLEALVNKRTVAQLVPVKETLRKLEELTGTGRTLGFLMSMLILFLGALSVAAMLITRFEAMSVQLAVLRALGYSQKEIRHWLLWEGLLLGVTACIVGAAADWILFPLIRSLLGTALPPAFLVKCPLYLSSPVWGMALAATVLAVFVPLLRISRQDIHQSLKGF